MNEIFLTGTVGNSFWEEDCFTAKTVREMIAGMSGPLTVRINSGGGIATEGQAIYTSLKNYDGDVTVIIEGIAASAASLIAMAGDKIVMPLGSIMMVHDPANWWTQGRGTEDDHLHAAKSLSVLANAYAGIYAARAGISVEEARDIMKAETYFDGPGAVEAGFATETDEGTDAAAVALFDYRLYPKAPESLRQIGDGLARQANVSMIAAMMAAPSQTKQKGKAMPKGKKAQGRAQMDDQEEGRLEEDDPELNEEDDPELEQEDDPEAEEDEDPEAEEDDDPEAEEEDEPNAHATAILNFAASRKIGADIAMGWIKRGLTIRQATKEYKMKHARGATMARPGAPRSSIIRDERSTRRTAMASALHAQITGRDPSTPAARPYMDMSLVEMAAAAIGHRGKIRSAGDKVTVFMDASHSTSDFPAIFQNALNRVLLERYSEFQPTYRSISKKKNFRDFRPMPLVRAGDFPMLLPVGETGEIKWGTFGESGETAVIVPYARGLTISRQMMINDDLGAINDLLSSYGETVAHFEERTFYSGALTAVLSDGNPLFHASRNNLAPAGGGIEADTVSAGRAAMRVQESIDGLKLNLSPSILLVGPENETAAEMFVAQITPTATEAVNPFSGKLKPVVTTEIEDGAWYLLSERAPCWVYGFLEGQEAPRVRTEEPFGTQGFSMTVEHDFGFGAADFRGGWKNPG
ncbi:protease and major capsid protein [Paracoccus phage vB_PbeS_Pben1]|uniref:ATP-dependent protease ClpP protease subunit n=1 Tax=Paracoccus versutus TaxID=34007 RepID=A0A3D9XZE3_PARVE|nr:head maturation protease, ClpP-related [Paracoccus versutus]AZV00197.1 protease and major capsid protein [Paracoccus phage vB_PbeS_Pben1]REF72309.1 ATP-dependent protease ClpP protease subunit [Paracoccus versutus]WGR55710.1 Clp protease ClpP [Paracoccus versutus]